MKNRIASSLALTCGVSFLLVPALSAQQDDSLKIPDKWAPWKDPENPNVIVLTKDKDAMTTRRDTSEDPERAPGLINPQRYAGGIISQSGFPTFLGAPMAFNTADLKAGKVDVALFGMSIGDQVVPGANFAANKMRALTDWASYPASSPDNVIGVDLSVLKIADYGNTAAYMYQNQRSLEEVHRVTAEILAADVVPIGIGGTHVQSYGVMTALAQKHGAGSFAVLHVDAHFDAYLANGGRAVHNGSLLRIAIENELIKGSDLIQVGLRGLMPNAKSLQWMRENKLRFHFQTEINHRGWDVVLAKVLSELKGKKVYISFDMDGIDPAYAPGVGTQDPDGLTAKQALQLVRAVAIQNEIVAAEFNEYNPLLDDAHTTTGVLMERLVRSLLSGMAGRKEGIKDPLFVDPERLDHAGGE